MSHYYKGKKTAGQHIKQVVWHLIYPIFTPTRDFLLKIGIIHHKGRQPYFLGHLAPQYTIEQLVKHLSEQGFHHHFVAWHDEGQVLSMRKHTDFKFQYHLRVFDDKEIRGHYELTPECHPLDHFFEKGMVPAKDVFKQFLGDYLVEDEVGNTAFHKAPEASIGRP